MPKAQLTIAAIVLIAACGPVTQPPPPPVGNDGGIDEVPLEILTSALPAFVVDVENGETLRARGGTPPYTWTLREPGPALAWLSLDSTTGRLFGVPDAVLETTVTVLVTDAAERSEEKRFDLHVQSCEPGASYPCHAPDAGICYSGDRLCSEQGALGDCTLREPSQRIDQCGASGEACGACDPNISRCEGGECKCGGAEPCPSGERCCGSAENPYGCVDVSGSIEHCGACGKACDAGARENVGTTCVDSACKFSCSTGFRNCNESGKLTDSGANDADGCEIDITKTANCGACGVNCLAGPNVTGAECLSNGPQDDDRYCKLECQPGFVDCDGKPENGCEKAVDFDTSCGTCAGTTDCRATYNSKPNVEYGFCDAPADRCDLRCDPGYENCNGSLTDGCETPLDTRSNCLSCGTTCVGTDQCYDNADFKGCATKCGTKYCPGGVGCHESLPNACGFM